MSPFGSQIVHHICGNRACVNPDHLEVYESQGDHARADEGFGRHNREKTHCKGGQPFSGDNLGIAPAGTRYCKTCNRMHGRKYAQKRRAAS